MKFTDAVKKLHESFGLDGKSYEERKSKEVMGLNEKPKSVKEESSTKKLDDDEKMIRLIEKVLESPPEEFVISPFIFEDTKNAREHNSKILEDYDYDFQRCMDAIDISVIHPGSEFRDPELLEPILKNHPDWPVLKAIMKTGVDLGLDKELKRDEETRERDFEEALKKGNSGTMRDPLAAKTVKENQEKEVSFGRVIPITLECARKLKNASICPLGCAIQWTIDEKGMKKIKMRTTHNLSFEWISGLSVNSMVEEGQLEEILYGHCLIRCIHIMHKMRLKHPEIAILLSKFDIDSAFRRMHSRPDHAPLFLTVLPDADGHAAYLDTRMPFGSNQGPGKFGKISETTTDIANHLMKNECWTPARLKSSFSDNIPKKKLLPASVKFGKAIPLLVEIEDYDSHWDVFVDDLINITLDQMNLEGKAREAAAIALELLFRPNSTNEEVKRNKILKFEKLLAEGGQEEVKVILGWLINSRIWNIKIPHEKAIRWMSDIDELISKGSLKQAVTRTEIESVLGKANEASFIVRELRFFFSRLRYRLKIAIRHDRAFLQPGEIEDLRLIRNTIDTLSKEGRSLNHVSMTIPSLFLKQDASTSVGIGGFMDLGFGWRIIFHPKILELFHINTLEHMAGVVNIWMAIKLLNIDGDGNGMKFLDQSDNMTAVAWMLRSTYYEKENRPEAILREIMARHLADLLFKSDTGSYLQHIRGIDNIIADILSRNRNLTNNEIRLLISQEAKEFIDKTNFELKMTDVPEEIISWIESLVLRMTQLKVLPKVQQIRIASILENGGLSQPKPDFQFSSMTSAEKNRLKSAVLSRTKSDIINLAKSHCVDLKEIQSKLPSTLFARPSSRMDFPVPK